MPSPSSSVAYNFGANRREERECENRKANTQGSLLRGVADSDVHIRHRNIGQLRNGSNSFITSTLPDLRTRLRSLNQPAGQQFNKVFFR
jgi:hypothetical protein